MEWIDDFFAARSIWEQLNRKNVIYIADREADFFGLYETQSIHPDIDLIVRAQHNREIYRRSASGGLIKIKNKMMNEIRKQRVAGDMYVSVGRTGNSNRERIAKLSVRFDSFTFFQESVYCENGKKSCIPLTLNCVHVLETRKPRGNERIEWYLLTTCPVNSAEDAKKIVRYYAQRWRIEEWHKDIKSNVCNLEDIAALKISAIERIIVIKMIIGLRVMFLLHLSRNFPNITIDSVLSDAEMRTLKICTFEINAFIPKNISEFIILIARMGGYCQKKVDYPGAKTFAKGMIKFSSLARYHKFLRD